MKLAALFLLLAVAACKKEAAAPPASHEGIGIVRGVKSEGRVLILEHEDIPGFMDAMTMPFSLENPALASGLKPGDKIRFTVTESGGDWPVTKIDRIE